MPEPEHLETLQSIAAEILRHGIQGYSLDELISEFRSELKLKPFLPEFTETELRHALSDVIIGQYGHSDPVRAGKFVKILNSEGKTASVPIDMSVHMDGLVKDIGDTNGDNGSLGFGISELDRAYGGFYPGDVMALVGAPGSMKTSLALNAVYDCFAKFPDARVTFFSLDMSTKKLTLRMLSRELDDFQSSVREKIKGGDARALARIQEIRRRISGKFKLIGQSRDGNDLTWDNIRDLITSTGPDLVIIDYFQLIAGYRSDMEALRVVLPKAVAMAGNYGIRFLLLSQIARTGQSDQKNKLGDHGAGGYYLNARVDVEIELATQADDLGHNHIIASVTKSRNAAKGKSFDIEYSPRTLEFTGVSRPVKYKGAQAQKFEL